MLQMNLSQYIKYKVKLRDQNRILIICLQLNQKLLQKKIKEFLVYQKNKKDYNNKLKILNLNKQIVKNLNNYKIMLNKQKHLQITYARTYQQNV